MKKNMGFSDRAIRTVLAIVYIVLYFAGTVTGTWGIVLLVFGAIFILARLAGVCSLYTIFGMNTCSKTNRL